MSDPNLPQPPWDGSEGQQWGQTGPPGGDQGGQWGQGGQSAPQPWGGAPEPRPSSMLPWSIAATLLCCLPAGIAGIVFASKSDSAFSMGDYAGGLRYHAQARTWTIVAVVIGPILVAAFFFIALVGGLATGGY